MIGKQRLAIYPFDVDFAPLLRHRGFMRDYDIVGVVSPNGWGLNGKDASCADGGGTIGLKVSNAFDNILDLCDAVLFTESHYILDFKKVVYPKIIKAIQAGKNIVCTMNLEANVEQEIARACKAEGVEFKYYNSKKNIGLIEVGEEKILEISTPVIFVLGISERTHKFELQLALREKLLAQGYKVSQVGSRSYCELLGFHSFPAFMYGPTTETDKIVLFNRYIKDIEGKENPDVIVIGIPGGLVPFNNQFTNKFGIFAYEVSSAVIPDAAVFSTLYEDFNNEYFEKLSTSIRYRLGFSVDCFNLSNAKFDWEESRFEETMLFTMFDSDFIDAKKKNFNILKTPVFNVLNETDSNDMACYLLSKLEAYGSVESV